MANLKIPYASTSPFLLSMVHASKADKSIPYYCPLCHSRLSFKRGSVRVPHFSHSSSSCSLESIYHLTAKSLILDIFREGLFYDIKFHSLCNICHGSSLVSFPKSVTNLFLEYSHNGYIYDIACFSGESFIFAIEIFHSHKVDSLKSLSSLVPIFEFRAFDVLSNPYCYPTPILHKLSWSDFLDSADTRSCCYASRQAFKDSLLSNTCLYISRKFPSREARLRSLSVADLERRLLW